MILYFLKSGLCLAAIYGIYRLLLEREKMPRFNRYFLLFGLGFSMLVPLLTLPWGGWLMGGEEQLLPTISQFTFSTGEVVDPAIQQESGLSWQYLLLGLYSLISGLFLLRFFAKLYQLLLPVWRQETVKYRGAQLVLLEEDILPYTFWKYIFVSKTAYLRKEIEPELIDHELAHAHQFHSLDILIVEALQVICWFNPMYYLYKRAIQLNHEFLADDQVVQTHRHIPAYQHLLLDKASSGNKIYLASNLNYFVTKKRLEMMYKRTSRFRAISLISLSLPLLVGLLLLFSNSPLLAQKTSEKKDNNSVQQLKDQYFKNSTVVYLLDDGKKVYKPYEDLSAEEKKKIPPPPPPPPSVEGTSKNVPLPEGSLVYLGKDGEVRVNYNGDVAPPPPPPPPPVAPPAPPTPPKPPKVTKAPKVPKAAKASKPPKPPKAPKTSESGGM